MIVFRATKMQSPLPIVLPMIPPGAVCSLVVPTPGHLCPCVGLPVCQMVPLVAPPMRPHPHYPPLVNVQSPSLTKPVFLRLVEFKYFNDKHI